MSNVIALNTHAETDVEWLVSQLANNDGAVREQARSLLVREGKQAFVPLVKCVNDARTQVRWEATRALSELRDARAVPVLIECLEDADEGVRWMAADGLIALGVTTIEPLLRELELRSDSLFLRQGAHRILQGLLGRDHLQDVLNPVIRALEAVEPVVTTPFAAQQALVRLRELQTPQGGAMNKNLVGTWMTPNPYAVAPKATLPEVDTLMKEKRIRRLPVVEHDKLVGIVTLGDVREAKPSDATSLSIYELNYLLAKLTVDKIMTRNPVTVAPESTLREAAKLMLEKKIGGLPVMAGDKLVGIITESDIFRALVQEPEI
jgi:CBS domain-containing protein